MLQFVEQVQQRAEIAVHLQQAVGPFAGTAHALEFVARHGRQMQHRVIEVDVERLIGRDAAPDETVSAGEVFAVDVAAHLKGQLLQVLDRTAFRARHNIGHGVTVGVIKRIIGPQALVVAVRDAVPLVEPVVGRVAPRLVADVPLAIDRGGVPGL